MQHLRPYDYETVRSDYMYSLEVITPPYNDGSRPRYAFPIKHQVLRCGKWIPTEEMYITHYISIATCIKNGCSMRTKTKGCFDFGLI